MTTRARILVLAFTFLASLPLTTAYAFNPVQARDISMGMTSAADAIGVRVVGQNPAFLALSDQPGITVSLPVLSMGFRFGNNAFSNTDISDYFQDGKYWTTGDQEYLAGRVAGDELSFTSDIWMRLIGVSFPAKYLDIAFTYDMGMSVDADIDEDLTDLLLLGNSLDDLGERKSFNNTDFSSILLSRIGVTFAKSFNYAEEVTWLDELTAGVTFNYFIGHSFFDIVNMEGDLLTEQGNTSSHAYFEVVGAGQLSSNEEDDFYGDSFVAGGGVGIDLGVGGKILEGRGTVGLSIINLVNQMSWTDGRRAVYGYDLDGIQLSGMNNDDFFEENFNPVDSLLSESEDLNTELPRLFKLDGAYLLNDRITLTTGLAFQFTDAIGSDAFVRWGTGVEY
ncbi:MAG TPA: hypothetical protein ENH10_07060, partial [Bacteroidetes bacterium]|nr:hypothetical protein [Bacteroidota bacterium]HEX04901.1 hypothetical protein [Bacteroidota bacterium]